MRYPVKIHEKYILGTDMPYALAMHIAHVIGLCFFRFLILLWFEIQYQAFQAKKPIKHFHAVAR